MRAAARLDAIQHESGIAEAYNIERLCDDLFNVSVVGMDVVFCCCVTWDPEIMFRLAQKLAQELEDGAHVLTVGKPLPHQAARDGDRAATITFREAWHGNADLDWGREMLVLHRVCVRYRVGESAV